MSGQETQGNTWVETQGIKPVEKKDLKQTVELAKADWIITKAELADIMDKYDKEKDDLTNDTKIQLVDLHKEIWAKMLKNWIKVEWWSVKLINKILGKCERTSINIDSFPEKLKDKDFVVTDSEQEWKLVIYEAGSFWERIWFIDTDWEFTPDSWFFDRNREWNDDRADIEKDRKINIETKPEEKKTQESTQSKETPKDEVKKTETQNPENLKIDDSTLKTKWITSYTKKNYSKYFWDINKLDFSRVKNNDEKNKIINALKNPSEENIKTLQTITGAKKVDKPQIDGKFWDNTMKALQTYVSSESAKPWDWEKAAASRKIWDVKADIKTDWKPEENKDKWAKDAKKEDLKKDWKMSAENPKPTDKPEEWKPKPTAIADRKDVPVTETPKAGAEGGSKTA